LVDEQTYEVKLEVMSFIELLPTLLTAIEHFCCSNYFFALPFWPAWWRWCTM